MAERQGFERELVDLGLDRTKEWFSEVERSGDRGGDQAYLVVVDGEESPITEGEYAFIQGKEIEGVRILERLILPYRSFLRSGTVCVQFVLGPS
jgi:hypothetical protein